MTEACFQMKGSVVTAIVLELTHYSETAFADQLNDHVKQAPKLFTNSPVVISLEKLEKNTEVDFAALLRACKAANLQPMAFRGVAARYADAVQATGLAVLPFASARAAASGKVVTLDPPLEAAAEVEVEAAPESTDAPAPAVAESSARPTKLVTQPVRSGQQIYAQGADLIIMSQVSEGAEVLADGHIHVYGTLRGRALAGVNGDTNARIFCRSLEAELLSVAGNFVLSEDLRSRAEVWKQPTQVFLSDENLKVEAL